MPTMNTSSRFGPHDTDFAPHSGMVLPAPCDHLRPVSAEGHLLQRHLVADAEDAPSAARLAQAQYLRCERLLQRLNERLEDGMHISRDGRQRRRIQQRDARICTRIEHQVTSSIVMSVYSVLYWRLELPMCYAAARSRASVQAASGRHTAEQVTAKR